MCDVPPLHQSPLPAQRGTGQQAWHTPSTLWAHLSLGFERYEKPLSYSPHCHPDNCPRLWWLFILSTPSLLLIQTGGGVVLGEGWGQLSQLSCLLFPFINSGGGARLCSLWLSLECGVFSSLSFGSLLLILESQNSPLFHFFPRHLCSFSEPRRPVFTLTS